MSGRRIEYRTKLLILYVLWWALWAYQPWDTADWILENILPVVFVPTLILTRNRFRFSNVSYTLMLIFLGLHAVGAHYTYAEVPYEQWSAALGFSINDLLGFTRNNFDRVVHFSFGLLLAYPVLEIFARVADTRGAWSYYFPLEWVMSLSMIYELIEWGAAETIGGDLGMAYLGTQGDVWDAHKDMALATLGAVIAVSVVAWFNMRYNRDFRRELAESVRIKYDTPLGEVKLRELKDKSRDEDSA